MGGCGLVVTSSSEFRHVPTGLDSITEACTEQAEYVRPHRTAEVHRRRTRDIGLHGVWLARDHAVASRDHFAMSDGKEGVGGHEGGRLGEPVAIERRSQAFHGGRAAPAPARERDIRQHSLPVADHRHGRTGCRHIGIGELIGARQVVRVSQRILEHRGLDEFISLREGGGHGRAQRGVVVRVGLQRAHLEHPVGLLVHCEIPPSQVIEVARATFGRGQSREMDGRVRVGRVER